MTAASLQPNLAMWCPEASDFLKALNKYVYDFLICTFEYTIALICTGRK